MMRKIAYIIILGAFLISCGGKKEVKPVSAESSLTTEAFAVAETVRNAFIRKDMTAIQQNSTEDGFRDITANKKAYDTVELSFTPRWVEIEAGKMHVNIAWKSTWTLSGRRTEARGMTVFLMEGKPMKLSKILRANPFVFSEQ